MECFAWTLRHQPVANNRDYYVTMATGMAETWELANRACMRVAREFRAGGWERLRSHVYNLEE